MNLRQEFVEAVNAHFLELTPKLDDELSFVAQREYPQAVRFFLLEYDSPHFAEDFSVSMLPMDRAGNTVGKGHWFLKGKAVVVPAKIYEAEKFEEIEPWSTASVLLEGWLVDRWSKSASARQRRPAFIGHHDSFFKTDLRTGTKTNWDTILKSVNP